MKKTLILISCLLLFSGCSGTKKETKTLDTVSTVREVLDAGMKETPAPAEETDLPEKTAGPEAEMAEEEEVPAGRTYDTVDVDLTVLSPTMVYAEVYNMITEPDDYYGKVIRMGGMYYHLHDENTGNDYFSCVIRDATACCAQGIEFVLRDDYIWPDDYPADESDITVVGVFDSYMEGQFTYYTLRQAILE